MPPQLDIPRIDGAEASAVAGVLGGLAERGAARQGYARVGGRNLCINTVEAPPGGGPAFALAVGRRGSVRHRGMLPVADSGELLGRYWIAYDMASAKPLSEYRKQLLLPTATCLRLLSGAARALDEAAKDGLFPSEVPPDSLFVTRRGVRLGDLGTAREAFGTSAPGLEGDTAYVVPEVLRGEPAEERAGVYAFGALLYHLLSGTAPRRGGGSPGSNGSSTMSLAAWRPDLPPALDAILAATLAEDPHHRPRSAGEALDLTKRVLRGEAPPRTGGETAPTPAPRTRPRGNGRPAPGHDEPASPTPRISWSDIAPSLTNLGPKPAPPAPHAPPKPRATTPRPAPERSETKPPTPEPARAKAPKPAAAKPAAPTPAAAKPPAPKVVPPKPADAQAPAPKVAPPKPPRAKPAAAKVAGKVAAPLRKPARSPRRRGPRTPLVARLPRPSFPASGLHFPASRLRPSPLVVAVACSLVLGIGAGLVLGPSADPEPARGEAVTKGEVTITAPPGWKLAATSADTLSIRSDASAATLGVRLDDEPPTRDPDAEPVRLGALQAWRSEAPGAVRYVAPTTEGTVLITCRTPAPGIAVLRQCERATSTLRIRAAAALPLSGLPEGEDRVRDTIEALRAARSHHRQRLAAASLPAGQRLAAQALASSHRRAAGALAALSGAEPVEAAAREAAEAYAALAESAGSDSSSRWDDARARVERSEDVLAGALSARS